MTLENTLLSNLSNWRPTCQETRHISLSENLWNLSLSADRCDELSCRLWELMLTRSEPLSSRSIEELAELLCNRAGALNDPLKIVEVDTKSQKALLRSTTPASRGDHVVYFEVITTGNREINLRRYQASSNGQGKREQIPLVLTHETLAQLLQSWTSIN